MSALEIVTIVLTGFVACAEFGSWAFVQPVLRNLPARERIVVQQGLLRTFGRFMPPAMVAVVVLGAVGAIARPTVPGVAAAVAITLAVVTTVAVNVPINIATSRWDAERPRRSGNAAGPAGTGSRASAPSAHGRVRAGHRGGRIVDASRSGRVTPEMQDRARQAHRMSQRMLDLFADRIPAQVDQQRSAHRAGAWPEVVDCLFASLIRRQVPVTPAERDELVEIARVFATGDEGSRWVDPSRLTVVEPDSDDAP